MNDRKYRQRGYMENDRPPVPGDRSERPAREFRAPNIPGFRQVFRCARCGATVELPAASDAVCGRCRTDLRSCAQCASFDGGARFECTQPVPERITPKDARNDCQWFEPRVTVERETGSTGPTDARRAFDDLFK